MIFFSLFASNLRIFVWIIISFLQFLAFQHIHIRFKDVWIFFSELFWTQKIHISHISDPPHMFYFQGILDIYGISLFTPDMTCQD